MARQQVSDELKAQAMADLLAGDQPAVVAHRYGLNRDTVNKWKQRLSTPMSADMGVDKPPAATVIRYPTVEERQTRIGSLIIELLEARLRTSLAIANHVSTHESWINTQTASDLANLDGHLHRTAVDVLDRLAIRQRAAAVDPGGSE